MSWQPIETAPKDGTIILIADADTPNGIHVASYDDEDMPRDHCWRVDFTRVTLHKNDPTHWMPLPEPPKSAS